MTYSDLHCRAYTKGPDRIGARNFNELINAIGNIFDFFTPNECSNFLKHAGYVSH